MQQLTIWMGGMTQKNETVKIKVCCSFFCCTGSFPPIMMYFLTIRKIVEKRYVLCTLIYDKNSKKSSMSEIN